MNDRDDYNGDREPSYRRRDDNNRDVDNLADRDDQSYRSRNLGQGRDRLGS